MMMSTNPGPPNDLLSTYKQYKADTESIAGWLAETAVKCGYKIPTPPSTRLKGKARKTSKQASDAGSPKPPAPSIPKYTIKVSDFVAMAKTIAECEKPKIKIPEALHNLFGRAIEKRRKFTEYCESLRHGNKDSNRRHSHFVGVLNAAWDTLRPSSVTRSQATTRAADTDAAKSVASLLSNRFAGLHVEDLDHVPDTTGEKPSASKSASEDDSYRLSHTKPATIVRDEDDIEAEFFFAITLFCMEIMQVRTHIRTTWTAYRLGTIELIQATIVTNTAILLVRQLENELDRIVERPRAYPENSYPVWTLPAVMLWREHDFTHQAVGMNDWVKVSDSLCTMECEHSELFFWDTFNALKVCAHHIKKRPKGVVLEDLSPYYSGFSESQRRIFRLFPLFQITTLVMLPNCGFDEVSRAIRTVCESQTVPIWAAFSIQVLLDIQDQLDDEPKKALEELKQHTRDRAHGFSKLETEDSNLVADMGPLIDMEHDVDRISEIALEDQYGQNLKRIFTCDLSRYTGPEADPFLRQNPLRCGMLKYDLYLQLHRRSLMFEEKSNWVTAMMHLYVACRSVFADDPVWPDMEYLLGREDSDHLFFGGIPQTIAEAEKKFLLHMGLKPSSLARDSRSEGLRFNGKNIRNVPNRSLLDTCFAGWMDGTEGADVDSWAADLVAKIHDPAAWASAAKCFGLPKEDQAALCAWWAEANSAIPVVCNNLGVWFQCECLDLSFEWPAMIGFCNLIWGKISSFVEKQTGSTGYQIPAFIVGDILGEARKAEVFARETGQDRIEFLQSHAPLLVGAWKVITDTFTQKNIHVIPAGLETNCYLGEMQLLKLTRMYCDQSPHTNTYIGLRQTQLYKNWPRSITKSSPVWYYLYKSHLNKEKMNKDTTMMRLLSPRMEEDGA